MPKEIKFKGIESVEAPLERPIEIRVDQNSTKVLIKPIRSEDVVRDREQEKPGNRADRNLSARAAQRLERRKVTARFFSSFLAVLAILMVWPALLFLYQWSLEPVAVPVPRWIFFSLFVAFLQILYGLMLGLIPDWTVLRSVSWFLVALSCFYCLVATAMAVGGSGSLIVRYLEVTDSLRSRGVIWLLAQVCLSVMVSLVTFREYWVWRRSETLIDQLFRGQTDIADAPEKPQIPGAIKRDRSGGET